MVRKKGFECFVCGKRVNYTVKTVCKACYARFWISGSFIKPTTLEYRDIDPSALGFIVPSDDVIKHRRDTANRRARRRRKIKGDVFKEYDLKKNYGITIDDYYDKLKEQKGCCAICGRNGNTLAKRSKPRNLSVDHDHNTGEIRGLLCNSCNRAIGFLNDSIDTLKNAIKYLDKYASC